HGLAELVLVAHGRFVVLVSHGGARTPPPCRRSRRARPCERREAAKFVSCALVQVGGGYLAPGSANEATAGLHGPCRGRRWTGGSSWSGRGCPGCRRPSISRRPDATSWWSRRATSRAGAAGPRRSGRTGSTRGRRS